MTDIFSKTKRGEIMSKIRSSRTSPELLLKSALEERAIPFQYQPAIRGKPDFLIRRRTAVFVNGCFWHKCPTHYREPKTNVRFWRYKVLMNEARLKRNKSVLRRSGFRVISFWEHDVKKNPSKCLQRVSRALQPKSKIPAISNVDNF